MKDLRYVAHNFGYLRCQRLPKVLQTAPAAAECEYLRAETGRVLRPVMLPCKALIKQTPSLLSKSFAPVWLGLQSAALELVSLIGSGVG